MDLKDSTVKGGVLITHQIYEGKHHYEVANVLKYKNTTGEKMFARRGDKLMQINDVDLEDLTPDELAQMLADGNPKLTVHKATKVKEPSVQPSPDEEILRPVSKESIVLSFSMELRREGEEENEVGEGGDGGDDGGMEGNGCPAVDKNNGDLLIITMKKTSISVVSGRGCEASSPCHGCHGQGCSFNDVVMVAESSTVTLVARGCSSFKQVDMFNASIEHVATHQYLRGLCSERTIYASPNPEKITIYHYKSSNIFERAKKGGVPVVLNLTDSNCFLCCGEEGGKVLLQVETCEKQKLKQISKSDTNTLAFLFYMKSDKSKRMTFESALFSGWFIQIANSDFTVRVEALDGRAEEHSFLFIIKK